MKQQYTIGALLGVVGALTFFLAAPRVFAYEAAPYAATMMPTFLTEKSAQLNGRVNPNEMSDTYQWCEWGISGRSDVYETPHRRLWSGNYQVDVNASLVGLAPSTQYFYRAVAENGRGKSVGATTYFTTKPLAAVIAPIALITTNDAAFISDTSATLRGYVSPHGNTRTKTWFEWGRTATMEHKTHEQGSWGDSAAISEKLDNLLPGTAYYFRAVAENEDGRSYGALKIFITTGVAAVVQQSGEAPREQYVPAPTAPGGDGVSRTTTTSEIAAPQVERDAFPQAGNRPGDFFSILFGGKKTATVPDEEETTVNSPSNGQDQVAGVGSTGIFSNLWSMLSGKKPVEVAVEKVGPDDVPMHTPIEYRIAYAYRLDHVATDAKLKITLPGTVIYIGDNTNNELLIDTGSGAERTYVLPLGRLENGSTRALSILGMTTGDAAGFPDARVRLEYTDKSGTHVVAAANGTLAEHAKENSASAASAAGTLLPSSLWGWIMYILIVVGSVFGVRKAKELYLKKKEFLAQENDRQGERALPPVPPFLPGATAVSSS